MNLIDSLIENNSIIINAKATTWQEAIKIGTDILITGGVITEDYYHAIIKHTKTYGPYFILAPHLAMPHARPEEGVLKTGFALAILDTPVIFGDVDNDPIKILITLATLGNEEHTQALMQIVKLFEKENSVDELQKCQSKDEIIAFIKQNSM